MTCQISNLFSIGSKKFRIIRARGGGLFNPKRIGWRFRERACSACWVGYFASYELLRNKEEKYQIYLRAVHCYGLEQIDGLNSYPTLLGSVGVFDEEERTYSYTNLEILIPFTGELFVERGFPGHCGVRRMPDTPEDETSQYCFTNGECKEVFRYSVENNQKIWGASDLFSPYDLVDSWPKRLGEKEAIDKFGLVLLKDNLSPTSFLREHPYFGNTDDVFRKLIMPAAKGAYDLAVDLDIPFESALWHNKAS